MQQCERSISIDIASHLRKHMVSLIAISMALAACFASIQARAACTASKPLSTITMPSSVTKPRDAAVGTSLTGWVYSETVNTTCVVKDGKTWSTLGSNNLVNAEKTTANDAGTSIRVFNTNIAGVGIAIQGRTTGCSLSSWRSLSPYVSIGCTWGGTGTYVIQSQIAVKYVVTGRMSAGVLDLANPVYSNVSGDSGDPFGVFNFDTTATTINTLGCITPDVTVVLGQQKIDQLPKAGSTTAAVPFEIKVNDCAKDLAAIKYSLSSSQAQTSLAGVVGPSSTSTSSGIGVKVTKPDGTAVPIDGTKMTISGYTASLGGNLTIPLKAAMYRLSDGQANAGTLAAEVEFTLYYE